MFISWKKKSLPGKPCARTRIANCSLLLAGWVTGGGCETWGEEQDVLLTFLGSQIPRLCGKQDILLAESFDVFASTVCCFS